MSNLWKYIRSNYCTCVEPDISVFVSFMYLCMVQSFEKKLIYGNTYVATSYLPTYVYRSTIARTYTRMQTVLQLLMPTYTRRILRCELVLVSDFLKLLEDFCVNLHTGRRLQKCRHTHTPLPQSPLLSLLDSQIDNHLQDVCFRRQ